MAPGKFSGAAIVLMVWAGAAAAQSIAPSKAMPLGGGASLSLSAEARLRYDSYENGQSTSGNDYRQGLLRGVAGADFRWNPALRVYGELATGQVAGRRNAATANFQNDASLQQLFVDTRGNLGAAVVGVAIGRQEFADGPRQLISLSDGPNLHRSWNGARFYANGEQVRVNVFQLRATRLLRGAFDEEINGAERLRGINASLVVASGGGANTYLDPFWIHSENPHLRFAGRVGLDDRDTVGARLWGQRGDLRFDWTLAHQSGKHVNRDLDAWGLFAVHSLALSNEGWKPRLTAHIDLASGGRASGSATLKGFNQLYASSNYLGEGQFLSLSNLLMLAPGLAVSPTPRSHLSVEYGFARRLKEGDAAYAGAMRAYAGSQDVPGREIGGLLRAVGTWSASDHLTLFLNVERLVAGDVLKRAQYPSGGYAYIGATWRY
ncbi:MULTISPECIES: alginate export family protein [unclassified Janthinobacterium]|uniref:alginate export family protein n=1 Tax=unclassified Janthinobacterium TaxID=2610881 RepID=UPI0009D9152C|nr:MULTISPECIES: alginate export family protein [unclassified Janthinobacterium]MEC5161371.1 hypothetical protein [Janthinobacterium sp. CG_S6]